MQVIFSDRAFTSLLVETAERHPVETGGIFLGQQIGDKYYVIETIDPGPNSIFQMAFFQYDYHYVNHLAKKVARLYKKPLRVLGLYHRHPGSFDIFSGTDDGTNAKFAALSDDGAISGLVNIDPEFRLTMFHVARPCIYSHIEYEVGDNKIPSHYLELCPFENITDFLAGRKESIYSDNKVLPDLPYNKLLLDSLHVLPNLPEEKAKALDEEEVENLLAIIEEDLSFLSLCGFTNKAILKENALVITLRSTSEIDLTFFMTEDRRVILKHEGLSHLYQKGLLKAVLEGVIDDNKHKRFFFKADKETVLCALNKLKKD